MTPLGPQMAGILGAAGTSGEVTRQGDLVGWWKFNSSSGATATDSSDTANNGTLANMADSDWVAGKSAAFGNCLEFDGTDDYVAIPADAAYPSTDFSLSIWLNQASGHATNTTLIESQGYADEVGSFNFYIAGAGSKIAFNLINTRTGTFQFDVTVVDGTWYHAAAVYTASAEEVEIYFDGSSVGTVDVGSATIDDWNDNGIWIGRDRTTSYWKGKLDDVRIYNVALTSGNVTSIYGSGGGDFP